MYIIQIMLLYIPSFNKVCYTLSLQCCFYEYIKLDIMQVRGGGGGYIAHLCARQFFFFF